jgi:S1-C subfamily serine protease
MVSISNPKWKAWMVKKRRHDLRLVTTLPPNPRLPPGFSPLGPTRVVTFSLSDESLEILDENDHLLTSLDVKDSAAAIKAVVKCVRKPPAQTVIRLPGWWTGKRPPMPMNYASQDFNAQEIFRIVAPSVYFIVSGTTREASIGSAVAVAADTALTNCHVIENQALIMVLDEGTTERLKARVSNADRSSDRCFLKIDGSLNPIAAVRRFRDLSVGERVYTIGNPSGLSKTLGEGLISGLREPPNDIRYVQTTAPISGGSSGGALVDSKGALVGITTFLLKDAQNLNFAIAAEDYWH